jgi:eukaryotic-like serine/threonine-protein kinase
MTRCHECESEVADNDLFCPYCGLSLPRAAQAAPGSDDAMASTIMMPFSAGEEAPNTSAGSEFAQSDPGISAVPTGGIAEQPPTSGFSRPERKDQQTSADLPPPDDIPMPRILADIGETQQVPATSADYSFGSLEEPSPQPTGAEPAKDETIRNFNEAPTMEDLVEGEVVENTEASIDIPREIGADAPKPGPVGPIGRPAEELEPPPVSSPMFDSVRIMENKLPPSQEDVATVIRQPDVQPPREVPPSQQNTSSQPANQQTSQPKPQTAHSIGSGDTDGKRSAKLKPLSEGTILNSRYEIVRKIGGGGMGAVYLASDNNLGGVLRAVKEMVQAHIEEEQQEKAILDFKRESMILSTLDHPSIPTIFDYFYDEKESRFYLVMKYISGGDLASRLRAAPEGKIDEHTVTEWAIQIADVLDYLHSQPTTIVYRDLKPSNIMVDGNTGRVMLIDFGIARSISQKEEKGVTAVGTMGYAPPELFSGNVEPRSDIYSLGSTMFHLMTGADPQSNPLLIFDFQKNPRPRQINPRLSDQMERILMRAVEYNADSRFRTAAELKQALQDHLAKLKTGNLTYGVTEIPISVSLANQTVFCGFCGQRIVATDLFCAFCGAKQPIAQQGVHSEIYAQPVWTARLVVEGTNDLNAPTYSLQKEENLLGRRDPMSNIFPEVDLSKYDPQTKISRRHARIWREGSTFMVEDLGSSNGTVLASTATEPLRLMPRRPHQLSNGDKIKIGDTTLHFVVG